MAWWKKIQFLTYINKIINKMSQSMCVFHCSFTRYFSQIPQLTLPQSTFLFFFFKLGIFFIYIFSAIPKVPHTLPTPHSPTHPLPLLGPGVPLYWGISILQEQCASLSNDGRPGQFLIQMQLETQVLGTGGYRLVNIVVPPIGFQTPFSSLGTLSSSSIGGPVIHPLADCEHPFLCLLGPGIVSQETALSGSFQQNLASVCNGVIVWRLIMGWIPGYCSL